jgi:hypothetical protein
MRTVAPLQQLLRAAILSAVAAAALAGCGADDKDGAAASAATPPSARMAALLDRVPAAANVLLSFDLAAARRELRLPADRAPSDPGDRVLVVAEDRFDRAALTPLRYLALPDLPAAVRAIDHGQVTGAVDAQIDRPDGDLDEVVILATQQPRREIQRRLRSRGWRRGADGGYTRRAQSLEPEVFSVIAFGNGFVVGATTRALARDVVAQTHAPDPRLVDERRLLDSVRGAYRAVFVDLPPRLAPCVRAVAGGQRFDARGDEDLVLTFAATPDPDRILLGRGAQRVSPATRDYRVRDTTVRGRELRMKIALVGEPDVASSAARLAVGGPGADALYRC